MQSSIRLGTWHRGHGATLDDPVVVSCITCDKLEPRKNHVTLTSVVQRAVETSRPLMDAGRQELMVALPAELLHLDADPVRLAQGTVVLTGSLSASAKVYVEPPQTATNS